MGPVAAFDEDVGKDLFDEGAGFVFIEDDNGIHGAEGGEDMSTVVLGVDGTGGAFVAANRGVAVESDDEGVTLFAGKFKIGNVTAMEDIEAAVSENESLIFGVQAVAKLAGGGGGVNSRGHARLD